MNLLVKIRNSKIAVKLGLIVGVPSVIALAGMSIILFQAWENYNRAELLERTNLASTNLIFAGAEQAKERGFTTTVLANPKSLDIYNQIPKFRTDGDRYLNLAIASAEPYITNNPVLARSHRKMLEAFYLRNLMRLKVDRLMTEKTATPEVMQKWFTLQTNLILAESDFGKALFIAQNPYELILQYNTSIKNYVFQASEYAGRERAVIARAIASGKPIPPKTLEELRKWRGVVEENLTSIGQLRANPLMPQKVLNRIGVMEISFSQEFEQVRQSVYFASDNKRPYPINTSDWIKSSTEGINSILDISNRVSEEAATISQAQKNNSLLNISVILVLLVLLTIVLIISVAIARMIARPALALNQAAKEVTEGDLSQQVIVEGTDELGSLSTSFNEMVRTIQTGIERLEAEKVSVEMKVIERTQELKIEQNRATSLAEELSVQNNKLHIVNQYLIQVTAEKSEFLSICSHDLKNPLSGILGLATVLKEDDPISDKERIEYATDIYQSGEFMLTLIKNLLEIGAIEQGELKQEIEEFNIIGVIELCIKRYISPAKAKGITINFETQQPNYDVIADKSSTLQVLDNLLSNAVKYSALNGSILITLQQVNKRIRVAIKDSGIGINDVDREKLFGKFARLRSKPTGGEHSTGLGLFIVKKIIESMDGKVWCESELGSGSTFYAEFPAVIRNIDPIKI